MNDKSDTPRTDAIMRLVRDAEHELDREREYAMLEAAQNGIEQLERELAEARAERNAAIARSMSNAMEAQAHEDRARMAEAECERLRDALQVCLSYWLSDANPDELQGSVAHMKHISGFAAAIDAALARNP